MLRLDTLVFLAARRWCFLGEIPGSHQASVACFLPCNKSLSRSVFYYLDVPLEVRINVEEVG